MEKKDTERAIVSAARELFGTYGYKKVSMDEIAKKASIVKGTIYIYFRDKEDLLYYFIKEELDKMKRIIKNNQELSLDFFDEVHKTVYELLCYRKNHKFLIKIAKEAEELKTMSTCNSIKLINNEILSYIDERIKEAINKKEIKKCNSKLMAFIFFNVYKSVVFEWEELNGSIDEKEISKNLGLFLKDGLKTGGIYE